MEPESTWAKCFDLSTNRVYQQVGCLMLWTEGCTNIMIRNCRVGSEVIWGKRGLTGALYIIGTFTKGSREWGESHFEILRAGIKQIQIEMGRGGQAL